MVDKDVIVEKIDFDRSGFDLVDLVDVVYEIDFVDKTDFDRSGRNSNCWCCAGSCSCNTGKILTLDCCRND